jgi:hypothetical protein
MLQCSGALGMHVIRCWGGGGYIVSAVEMAMVGLQVATLVVSQNSLAHEVAAAIE